MKNIFFAVVVSFLMISPVAQAYSQTGSSGSTSGTAALDTTGLPQWVKDMRRVDIILFGSFPFSLFVVTFLTDLHRWNEANGMDWNDLRYAPWPLKSAGAVEMSREEYERTLLIAVGVSAVLAIVDLIIVKTKENKQRRRIESMPSSSHIINITQPEVVQEEEAEAADDTDSADSDVE
jgi:hypothetical protein